MVSRSSKQKVVPLNNSQDSQNPARNLKPLSAFTIYDLKRLDGKGPGKGKAKVDTIPRSQEQDTERLWIDTYQPTTEADLAVHKRKVEDVRRWLGEALGLDGNAKLMKYRRILVLTGPSGTAKTTTVRVLAREMGIKVSEWNAGVDMGSWEEGNESISAKFQAFITRATSCSSVLESSSASSQARKLILLKDLPNILHPATATHFHSTLQSFIASDALVPIVIVVSDAGVRGEDTDEGFSKGWGRKEVVDVRSVLGPLNGVVGVNTVGFNPIAPTLLRKALLSFLSATGIGTTGLQKKEIVDAVVEGSNGDIRSAIMGLQFAFSSPDEKEKEQRKGGKGKGKRRGEVVKIVAMANREQSLQLFHLMGKVLYNKRKGDPPNPSATARDIQREKDLDALVKEPDKEMLPVWWRAEHERRGSRVNVDMLYADSPIDSSLFGLYVHQNYPQFCDGVEHCEGVSEWLSWVDWNGGEDWYQANPHRFHLLTLGTLHSLPSPVTRRSQKFFKPEWFEVARKEKDGWDGVGDVRDWLLRLGKGEDRLWSKVEIATELGGILKEAQDNHLASSRGLAPATHRLFSSLHFGEGEGGRQQQLVEGDAADEMVMDPEEVEESRKKDDTGGWLENDDIEEF